MFVALPTVVFLHIKHKYFLVGLCELISTAMFLFLLCEKLRQNNAGNCSHEHTLMKE